MENFECFVQFLTSWAEENAIYLHSLGKLISLLFTSNLYLMYIICLLDLITSDNSMLQGQLRHDTRETKALFCGQWIWSVYLPRCSQLVTPRPRKGTLTPPSRGSWRCEKGIQFNATMQRPIKAPQSLFVAMWSGQQREAAMVGGVSGLATPPPASVLSVRPATLHS